MSSLRYQSVALCGVPVVCPHRSYLLVLPQAHLRDGGHAVLLMPPTVASLRAGRCIRAELLRRGALRAVIALSPEVAAPHGVPLHLWVLRRPAPDAPPPARTLLVDAAGGDLTETGPRLARSLVTQ